MGIPKPWALEVATRYIQGPSGMIPGWVFVGLCLLVPCPPILPCSPSSPRLFRRAFEQRRALRSFSIRSLGHTARCRKFVFAPACRGIQSKRVSSSTYQPNSPPLYLSRDTQGPYPQSNNNMLGGGRRPEMMLVEPDSVKKDAGSLEMPGLVDNKKQIKLGSQRLLEGLVEDNLVRELLEEKLDIARRPPRTVRPLDPQMGGSFLTRTKRRAQD